MTAAQQLIDATNDLAALLEAATPKGLKHRRHQQHIAPARARLQKLFAGYFDRQGAAVLEILRPRIEALLLSHPRLQEADGGEWVTIHGHPVLIGGSSEDRAERARKSQVLCKKEAQAIAEHSEQVLANSLGMGRTSDNSPFDLRTDSTGVEVKTLVNQKNDKITMSKAAIGRKLAEQRADDIQIHTVVADRRKVGIGGKATYYYHEGVGSFRLGSMEKVSISELKQRIKI